MGKEKDEWGGRRGSLGRRGKGQSREGKREEGCGEGEGKRYCTITSHLLQGEERVVGIP